MPQSGVEPGRRQQLSAAELLERGCGCGPGLSRGSRRRSGCVAPPEATTQEFHDTGILRVIQPAAFGSFEADFICQIDLTWEVARACGASG